MLSTTTSQFVYGKNIKITSRFFYVIKKEGKLKTKIYRYQKFCLNEEQKEINERKKYLITIIIL